MDEEEVAMEEIGYYYATHNSKSQNSNTYDWLPDYYTYLTPAGLPYSLPQEATNINFGGVLKKTLSSLDRGNKIFTSKEVITSFKLDGTVYVAKTTKTDFIGYIKQPKISEFNDSEPRADHYTLDNLDQIDIFNQSQKNTQKSINRLEEMEQNDSYFGSGPIIRACEKCGSIFCNGNDCLPCPKCGELGDNCYCGKACICFAHKGMKSLLEGTCDYNRSYGIIGIPFFDKKGNLESIKKYKFKPTTEKEMMYNYILTKEGLDQFYKKLGVNTSAKMKDVVSNTAKLTLVLENTTANNTARKAFKKFNNLYNAYSISKALENENFVKAFYNALKYIPTAGQIVSGFEEVLKLVYSENFLKSMRKRTKQEQIKFLGCNSKYCKNRLQELNNLEEVIDKNLKRIQNKNLEAIHNEICTCPK
jgi:hypothetical protein